MKNIIKSVLLVTLLLNHHAVSAATLCGDTQIAYINSFVNGIINKIKPETKFGQQALNWWSNFQNTTAHTYTSDSLPNNTQADLITNGLTCCYPGQAENFEIVIRAYVEAFAGPDRQNLLQIGVKSAKKAFNQCFPEGVPGTPGTNDTQTNNGTAPGGQPPKNGTAAGGQPQPPNNGTAAGGQNLPPQTDGATGTAGNNQSNGVNLGCPPGQLPSETGCQAADANLLCPDGSTPSRDGCPFSTFKCPDGKTVPDQDGQCPATAGKCPDGSFATATGCPAACPDGSKPGTAGCPVVVQPCKDGSKPASDGCPKECPGGLKPTSTGCPSFTPKCSDGSDPTLTGCPARCLDGSIPTAAQGCPPVPLNCPVLDIPPGPQGCPPKCADGKYQLPTKECPTDANQPQCPDGTTVTANGCPQLCPDGKPPAVGAECTQQFKKCLDGSDPSKGCPASCPDGTAPTVTGCPKVTPKCPDGSDAAADGCPKLCPDKSIPDATKGCSAVVLQCKGPNGPTDPTNTGCPGACPDGSPIVAAGCPQICFDNSQAPAFGPCRRNCPGGKPLTPEGCKLPEIKQCPDGSIPTATGCPKVIKTKFCDDGSIADSEGKCPEKQVFDAPKEGNKQCTGDAAPNKDGKCPLDAALGNVDKAQKNFHLGQNKLIHQYAKTMSRIHRGVLPVLCSDPDAPNKAYINADGTLIINEADQAKVIEECTTSLNAIFSQNLNDIQSFVVNQTNLQLKATGDKTACTTINATITDTFKSLNPCNGDCKTLCTDYFSIFSNKILEEVITKSDPDAGTPNSQLRRRLASEYTTSATGGMSAYSQNEIAEGSIEVQGANDADLTAAAEEASKDAAANPVDFSAATEIAAQQGDEVQEEQNNSVIIQRFGLLLMIALLLI